METVSWIQFILASCVVLGLMALLAWGLKYLASRGLLRPQSGQDRLAVLSSLAIDGRRRLVLTRCDKTEYLLLLGAGNDLLLSTHPAAPAAPEKDQA